MLFLGGLGVFYFISLIIQYYVLLPVMVKVTEKLKWGVVLLSFVISEISVFVVIYYTIIRGYKVPSLLYAGYFPVWIVFYITGIYLGKISKRKYGIVLPIIFGLAGLLLSQLESVFLNNNYGGGFGIKPSSFLFSLAVIYLLFADRTEKEIIKIFGPHNKLLEYLGGISFAIYLVHYHFKKIAILLFDNWMLRWLTMLLLSIIVINILQFCLPQRYHKYLGIVLI